LSTPPPPRRFAPTLGPGGTKPRRPAKKKEKGKDREPRFHQLVNRRLNDRSPIGDR
jgi:hypothetical protein